MKLIRRSLILVLTLASLNLQAATYSTKSAATIVDADRAGEQSQGAVSIQSLPLPAVVWLIGAALIGVVALRRRAETPADKTS